jgi:hypothetical protein
LAKEITEKSSLKSGLIGRLRKVWSAHSLTSSIMIARQMIENLLSFPIQPISRISVFTFSYYGTEIDQANEITGCRGGGSAGDFLIVGRT